MKAGIHPDYIDTTITCNCGEVIHTRSTVPTINIEQTGTRKEELLLEKDELQKVWLLRKALSQLNPVEAMELLLDKLKLTKTNKDFLNQMNQLG